MRQVLFWIPLDAKIPIPGASVPVFGAGVVLFVWLTLLVWNLQRYARRYCFQGDPATRAENWQELAIRAGFGCLVAAGIYLLPQWVTRIPIYGYGSMLLAGFLTGGWLAAVRARRENLNPDVIWDVGMWIFVPGIIGARAFFIIQHADAFFRDDQGRELDLMQKLFAIVNLPRGGLVLYGGVILGIVGYLAYCHRKQISALYLADVLIPAIFVGEMFGRVGCFLNGCCFGDVCELPWGVTFPQGSVPFASEVERGLIPATAAHSLVLQPAQLYSSFNALILAVLTWNYFPHRRRNGEVLLVGWLAYPVTRFFLELVRGDELPWGWTPFTISQNVSLGMFSAALIFAAVLYRRPPQGIAPVPTQIAPGKTIAT